MATISTTISHGITLGTVASAGTYTSPLTITASGAVEASSSFAVFESTAATTIVNQGTILGGTGYSGIFVAGEYIVDNVGLIEGYEGVGIGNASTVTNSGTIVGTGTDTGAVEIAGNVGPDQGS